MSDDETAAPSGLMLVYARKRPPSSRTVHLARDDGGRALCGVHRGDAHGGNAVADLEPQEVICPVCSDTLAPARSRENRAPSRPEPDPLHEWKASILIRADGLAEVALNGFSELLNEVIKEAPGRRWDRDLRVWLVPASWAPELSVSLSNAGVEVRTTEQRAICPRCRQELEQLAENLDFS
jgi:hypothetical protein